MLCYKEEFQVELSSYRRCRGKCLEVIGLHDFRCYLHVASWILTPFREYRTDIIFALVRFTSRKLYTGLVKFLCFFQLSDRAYVS